MKGDITFKLLLSLTVLILLSTVHAKQDNHKIDTSEIYDDAGLN